MNRRGFLGGLLAAACSSLLRIYPAPAAPKLQVRQVAGLTAILKTYYLPHIIDHLKAQDVWRNAMIEAAGRTRPFTEKDLDEALATVDSDHEVHVKMHVEMLRPWA